MKQVILILSILFIGNISFAQEKEIVVPYTLADRDRMVRIETRMDGLDTKMNALETKVDVKFDAVDNRFSSIERHFDSLQKQMDHQQSFMYWIAGLLILMFGYLIWDRRTAMFPIRKKAEETDGKLTNLLNALRELARTDKELAKLLRSHGLL